tara:strand:- start:235 stop:1059 length:825 start_codon:yes stop_codon:yes gene_type:complete
MEICIICNSRFDKINDYVFKCKKCSFLKSNLKSGYGREVQGIEELRRDNFKKIISAIKSLDKFEKLKILEIGSGDGFFIDECKKWNIDITGSEANEKNVLILKKKFSNILKISLPIDLDDKFEKYDYVVFNDVFEHLENLDMVINQIGMMLNKEGKILINLPSSDGFLFKFSHILFKLGITNFYDRLWQKNLSSPHLSYFNNSNLKLIFKKHGYNLIYSNYLNTISKTGNFKRLNSTIKNKLICFFITFFLMIFFYLQKILSKDIIFHIYTKKK